MTPAVGCDEIVAGLVASICGFERGFGPSRAIGFWDGKRLVGGLVFHNWTPEHRSIEVSVGSLAPGWMTKPVMEAAGRFAFEGCDCHTVCARTSRDNPTRKAWRILGAREYEMHDLRGPGQSEFVYVLTAKAFWDSRFMKRG